MTIAQIESAVDTLLRLLPFDVANDNAPLCPACAGSGESGYVWPDIELCEACGGLGILQEEHDAAD
jgi:hypothetical protein